MGYLLDQRKKGMRNQSLADAKDSNINSKKGVEKDLHDYPSLVKADDKKMRGKINAVDKKDYEKFKKNVSDPIKRQSY